jgi:hypothetical protein
METANITISEREQIRQKTAKPMLWLAIVSMIMLFAGLTSAYVVRLGQGNWLKFDMPLLLPQLKKATLLNLQDILPSHLCLGSCLCSHNFMDGSHYILRKSFSQGIRVMRPDLSCIH